MILPPHSSRLPQPLDLEMFGTEMPMKLCDLKFQGEAILMLQGIGTSDSICLRWIAPISGISNCFESSKVRQLIDWLSNLLFL